MLVYIKDSALNTVLKEVSSDVIPPGVLGWENVDTKAQNEHSLSLCLDDSYQNAWTRALMQIFPYSKLKQQQLKRLVIFRFYFARFNASRSIS